MNITVYPKRNGEKQKYQFFQIHITENGKTILRVSTGKKISDADLKYWNNGAIDQERKYKAPELFKLNTHFDRMKKVCEDAHSRGEDIREALDRMNGKAVKSKPSKVSSFYDLLDSLCKGDIKKKGFNLADNSLGNYRYLRSVLNKYDSSSLLTFEDWSVLEWNRFHSWLEKNTLRKYKDKRGTGPNSIATLCGTLRSVLNCGVSNKLTTNVQHKDGEFTAQPGKVNSIYLTTEEIEKLYDFKIADPKLKIIRNWFVLATQTGARYSDWSKMCPENYIQEGGETYLEFTPKKTERHETEVTVILSPLFKAIIKSYGGRMPPLPSYNEVNTGLKKICLMAGLKIATPKAARTSLVTNKFMAGMSTTTIKTITGHKSNAFEKYLKIGKVEARQLQKQYADEVRFGKLKAV